jgi:sulfur-carrier protein adenylyltransferase/sulfurtransferase
LTLPRYLRQTTLATVGNAGQARLAVARILIVGMGGLGCPVALYLAAAGVGHLTLMDGDVVSLTNLHRQILYTESDIGALKVEAALKHLKARNSAVSLTPLPCFMVPHEAGSLVVDHDIIIDAADRFVVTYALSDACLAAQKPLITASVQGTSGYMGGFCGGGPSYRALFPVPPLYAPRCDEIGVLGTLVGQVALAQAHTVLRLLLKNAPSPLGVLQTFSDTGVRSMAFHAAPEPAEETHIPFLVRDQLTSTDIVFDVRSMEEQQALPYDGVVSVPLKEWGDTPPEVVRTHKANRLVFVCSSGARALTAATRLYKEQRVAVLSL